MQIKLNKEDLKMCRVTYKKLGCIEDNPTLWELICKYASKYNIVFDDVEMDVKEDS